MSVLCPPEPREDELELLIREARARRRKRWFGAAALAALLTGAALAIFAIVGGTAPRAPMTGHNHGLAEAGASRCGIRTQGVRLFKDGRTVYREPGHWVNPNAGPGADIQCSGSTIWAVFALGVGMSQDDYVGVRSADRGRTWRVAFAQNPAIRGRRYDIGPEVGPWALAGPRAAYFVGVCPACSNGKTTGTFALSVTKDGGRTFRNYSVPAPASFQVLRLRIAGKIVTILGRKFVRRLDKAPFEVYRRETLRVRVA